VLLTDTADYRLIRPYWNSTSCSQFWCCCFVCVYVFVFVCLFVWVCACVCLIDEQLTFSNGWFWQTKMFWNKKEISFKIRSVFQVSCWVLSGIGVIKSSMVVAFTMLEVYYGQNQSFNHSVIEACITNNSHLVVSYNAKDKRKKDLSFIWR